MLLTADRRLSVRSMRAAEVCEKLQTSCCNPLYKASHWQLLLGFKTICVLISFGLLVQHRILILCLSTTLIIKIIKLICVL